VFQPFLSRIPWLGRYFSTSNVSAAAAGASFESAAAGLTPEYIAAVAQSQNILARVQAAVKVEGVTASLLFLAGLSASIFDILPSSEEDEPEA
jgi:succinyl-CoA synthetase alpha subunit